MLHERFLKKTHNTADNKNNNSKFAGMLKNLENSLLDNKFLAYCVYFGTLILDILFSLYENTALSSDFLQYCSSDCRLKFFLPKRKQEFNFYTRVCIHVAIGKFKEMCKSDKNTASSSLGRFIDREFQENKITSSPTVYGDAEVLDINS